MICEECGGLGGFVAELIQGPVRFVTGLVCEACAGTGNVWPEEPEE